MRVEGLGVIYWICSGISIGVKGTLVERFGPNAVSFWLLLFFCFFWVMKIVSWSEEMKSLRMF